MILILIFAEVLGMYTVLGKSFRAILMDPGLYGLIVALLMNSRTGGATC